MCVGSGSGGSELRSCVKVEVDVPGLPVPKKPQGFFDVKQLWNVVDIVRQSRKAVELFPHWTDHVSTQCDPRHVPYAHYFLQCLDLPWLKVPQARVAATLLFN